MQGLHRLRGLGARRVGKGEEPGGPAVNRDEKAGGALPRQLLGHLRERIRRGAARRQKLRRADRDVLATDLAGDAKAGLVREIRQNSRFGRLPRFRRLHQRAAQGVFRARLDRRRQRQQVFRRGSLARHDPGQDRPAFGQRAGLVEGDGFHAAQGLQCVALAEDHAQLRRPPGPGDQGRRRGEAHGAGTGDDQHIDGADQSKGQMRHSGEIKPEREGGQRRRHHGGHEKNGDAVGEVLDRQARALRRLDHADDIGEKCVGRRPWWPGRRRRRRD